MPDPRTRLVLDDFSRGRQGHLSPLDPAFPPNGVVSAINGDWYRTKGFRKRNGVSAVSMTGGAGNVTTTISWLGRHVPGTNEADAELWYMDDHAATPELARLDNSTTWTVPTVVGEKASFTEPWNMTSASCHGKFFLAYQSAAARLHVWDPVSNNVRRTGISPGTVAATVADTGAGAYAATLRYYRVRFYYASSVVLRRSEPTPVVSFTPSGGGTHARVTRPTTPTNEDVNGWEIEASADNVTFYRLAQVAIGTTTYDDNIAPANYATTGTLSALTGTYSLQKAYRFIAADQNRLIGFGSFTSTDVQNRVEFSAVIGSLDVSDEERVDTTVNYYLDLDEKDSGVPTGLIGPLWGNYYALKSRQIWELAPTGEVDRPFRSTAISKVIGSVSSKSACIGEDANGSPCLYTMSHRGMYRYGAGGLVYIGREIEDAVLGPTSTMNLAAAKMPCHMLYHPDRRQLWVWWAVASGDDPSVLYVLDVQSGGWSQFTGNVTGARCAVMFADSLGATMGYRLKPYVNTNGSASVMKADDTSATTDLGSGNFQATLTTRPIQPGGAGYNGQMGDLVLLAPVATGVTLTATVTPDFAASATKTGTALLTAAGSETRVSKRMAGTDLESAQFLQITLGDAAASTSVWSFDRLVAAVSRQEAIA